MNGEDPLQLVKSSTRVWVIVFEGGATLITLITVHLLRGSAELFKGFGADLPAITRLFIDLDAWLLAVPLAGLIPTVLLFINDKLPEHRIRGLFGWTVAIPIVSMIIFALWVYAMYLPIFELGNVV